MKTEYNDGKLVINLEGRIDTNNASFRMPETMREGISSL